MTTIQRNQVIEWWRSGEVEPRWYRILHINQQRGEAELFDLTAYSKHYETKNESNVKTEKNVTSSSTETSSRVRNKLFIAIDLSILDEALKPEGGAHVITPRLPNHVLLLEKDLTEKEAAILKSNWTQVAPLIDGEEADLFFNRSLRGGLVEKRAKELGKSASSLYRILYRYFAYGMTMRALNPNLRNRGAPGKSREAKSPGVKIGAPRRPGPHDDGVGPPQGRNVNEQDIKRFRLAQTRYLGVNGATESGAYKKMLAEIYKVGTIINKKFQFHKDVDPSSLPTLRQFRYALTTKIDPLSRLLHSKTEKQQALKHRQLGGRPRADKYGPGEQYEIDSTPTQISLVSDLDHQRILGLATIYSVFDTSTELIVGGTFSWCPSSWEIAREALYNAFTSKVAYCARYDYEISDEMWPSHHIPHSVLADRQELLGADAKEALVNGMAIVIGITPPGRGDFKAYIERSFGLINGNIEAQSLEGAAPPGLPEPGAPNPKTKSIMTLTEFAKLYLRAIVDYNHNFLIKEGIPTEAIRDGVRPYPINLWNWGLENGIGSPQQRTSEEILLHLLPRAKASIQRDGIYLSIPGHKKKLRYSCARAVKEQWYGKARNFGRNTIDVHYEPGWTNHIWLRDEKGGFERADLADLEEAARNHRIDEALAVLDRAYTPTRDEQRSALESSVGLHAFVSELREKAKDRKKPRAGKSQKELLGGMKEARQLEREIERARRNQNSAKVLNLPAQNMKPNTQQPAGAKSESNSLDLFRKSRDKALEGGKS